MAQKLYNLPQYTIAAIYNIAIGGGFEISLLCDYIIAHENTRIGLPESSLGLFPGIGGQLLLEKRIPPRAALKFVIEGKIKKLTNFDSGLIDLIVSENPEVFAKNTAIELCNKPNYVIRACKKIYLDNNFINFSQLSSSFYNCLIESDTQDIIRQQMLKMRNK
jgi:enoyl-CoA hydratase/carnithine racemase